MSPERPPDAPFVANGVRARSRLCCSITGAANERVMARDEQHVAGSRMVVGIRRQVVSARSVDGTATANRADSSSTGPTPVSVGPSPVSVEPRPVSVEPRPVSVGPSPVRLYWFSAGRDAVVPSPSHERPGRSFAGLFVRGNHPFPLWGAMYPWHHLRVRFPKPNQAFKRHFGRGGFGVSRDQCGL
jgi:hypothetical protein